MKDWLRQHTFFTDDLDKPINSLNLSGKDLNDIPKDFKNLKIKRLILQNMQKWSNKTLEELPKDIEELHLGGNLITSFDCSLFPKLSGVYLNNTALKSISLTKTIKSLSLRENRGFCDQLSFKGEIEELDISNTLISHISGNLKELSVLLINQTPNFNHFPFENLPKLEALRALKIEKDILKVPKTLKSLEINRCAIKTVDLSEVVYLDYFSARNIQYLNKIMFSDKMLSLPNNFMQFNIDRNYTHQVKDNNEKMIDFLKRKKINYNLLESSKLSDI